ncbi:MAG: TetR family transcriptional regulator [Solirubrobacterales bacterium]
MNGTASYGQRSRLAEPRAYRERLIAAMTVLAADHGRHGVTVERVCEHAAVSKVTFYEFFSDLDDCFAVAVEEAHEALWSNVERGIESVPAGDWALALSAAVMAFLTTLEAHPTTAWLCVVEPMNGVPRAVAARRQLVARLAELIPVDVDAAPLPTAPGSVGALWELVLQHLTGQGETRELTELAGSSIFLVLAPYVGRRVAMQHAMSPPSVPPPAAELRPPTTLIAGLTQLARSTLLFLADHRGASNAEISLAVSVPHASQMSRHLHRLEHQGLVRCVRNGRRNAWSLTELGEKTVAQVAPSAP